MIFQNRREAGEKLAREFDGYAGRDDVIVLGLPRGGVPVAYEIATAINAPLDVFIVRKLGVPGHEELAMGAIASGGIRVRNQEVIGQLNIPDSDIEWVARKEQEELKRREEVFRGERAPADVEGKTVIVVDDGLATGSTMRAAVRALKAMNAARVVVAVPTAPPATCDSLRQSADEVVCLSTPEPFAAIGQWYEDFRQTQDDEVRDLLARGRREAPR